MGFITNLCKSRFFIFFFLCINPGPEGCLYPPPYRFLPFTEKTSANPFLLSTEKENSWLLVGNAPVKKKTLRFTPSQCTFGIRHLGNRTKFGSGYGKRSFLKGLIYFGTTKVSPLCIL